MSATRDQLVASIKVAEKAVVNAKLDLEAFDDAPEQNVFASIQAAEETLTKRLKERAWTACFENRIRGLTDYFSCGFSIDGKAYEGKLTAEYAQLKACRGRYDQTITYLENVEFSFTDLERTRQILALRERRDRAIAALSALGVRV